MLVWVLVTCAPKTLSCQLSGPGSYRLPLERIYGMRSFEVSMVFNSSSEWLECQWCSGECDSCRSLEICFSNILLFYKFGLFKIGRYAKIRYREDSWVGDMPFSEAFPQLFWLSAVLNSLIKPFLVCMICSIQEFPSFHKLK